MISFYGTRLHRVVLKTFEMEGPVKDMFWRAIWTDAGGKWLPGSLSPYGYSRQLVQLVEKGKMYHVSIELNTSGSLGEQEMLWEHELQVSVSTAFSRSPKLSRVFL